MQVTPEVAFRLYSTARDLAAKLGARDVLDLFCGVGGFSLHVASVTNSVVGVELSDSAIRSARESAALLGYQHTTFHASDVDRFLSQNTELRPDLVIANPPRRGLSHSTINHIVAMTPQHILYSSCNPETFARDAALLCAHYDLNKVIPFDMFPMTRHCEVLGIFSKGA
jgi:23S rRNA (uracil747-C5)-methyltransferase